MTRLFVRPARGSDSVDIARLMFMSSDGIAEYIWAPHVVGRGSLIAVGTQRCARDDVPFSYRNCLIAEQGGRIAGSLHGVAMPLPFDENDPLEDDDPVLQQLLRFSDRNSLEIRGLAVYPEFRGQGAATMLIETAALQAREQGLARLSVICFVANESSISFFRHMGFTEARRGPSPDHSAFRHTGGEMLLITRPTAMALTAEMAAMRAEAANAACDCAG